MPRVYAALGLICGSLMIIIVMIITYGTIAVMLQCSELQDTWTYASTMHKAWGRKAAAAVHAAIIAGCIGFVSLYLIVTCDVGGIAFECQQRLSHHLTPYYSSFLVSQVLVGNKVYTGIISDLFPQLPDPLPWYLCRTALLTYIALVSAPLLAAKSLHGMALTSAISVLCSTLSMSFILGLGVAAAWQGTLAPLRWWPNLSFFGSKPTVIATHLIATLPVVMTAFVCQMSVHPVARDLREYTPQRMRKVIAWSLTICAVLYGSTGAWGYQTFGDEIEGDVLSNIQPEALMALLGCGDAVALAFTSTLKGIVALSLLTSIPINLWPLREDVMGLLTHAMHGQQPSRSAFYTVTYLNLFGIWLLSVAVESAYSMIGLVGATCGIAMAFFFPGMLAMRVPSGGKGAWVGGVVLLVLGTVLMLAGISSTLMEGGGG